MEFFSKAKAVRLRSHLNKYLVADDDQETVRQSRRSSSSRKARWLVELVEGNSHVVRLKSCHGRYLTASNSPFPLGLAGNKVLQTIPESMKDLSIEWEPIRDGFQVKLRVFGGKFLRGNGGAPPWRNSVTYDNPHTHSIRDWALWDVEAVDVPEDESLNDYLLMVSSFSAVSDELSCSELGSPVSVYSSNSPNFLSMKKTHPVFQSAMDLFSNAKAVRLRSHHDKYLHAENDDASVTQDRNASSKNARWTVEFLDTSPNIIRLKSSHGKYLTASNHPFLLGMTGRKVLLTLPPRLDSSLEWEPIRAMDTNQVKLKTRYGQFLRANAGLPPWRNSVTHDIPHRTATQDWILWEVDVVEISVPSPAPRRPLPLVPHSDSFASSETSSPSTNSIACSTDSLVSSPPTRGVGRTICYQVADEYGNVDDDAEGLCITVKGNGVDELTRRLEEETGLEDITVCSRSPLNGMLYPLRLQLPPNNVNMNVVVVQRSSKVAKDLAKTGMQL